METDLSQSNNISKYYCLTCEKQLNNYKHFWEHQKSMTHMKNSGTANFKYNCDKCDHHTNSTSGWNKHLETNGHKLSPEDNRKLRSEIGSLCAATGDKAEEYILNILKTNSHVESATRIGQTGNRFDIIYQMKGEKQCRALQVKTLSKAHSPEQYSLGFQKSHMDDTLIIGLSSDRQRFCLYLFGDSPKLSLSLTFTETACSNNGPNVYLFTDLKSFTKKLFKMVKLSTVTEWNRLTDHLTDNWAKEFKMIERLKLVLEELNLNYQPMMTVNSSIDGLINNCRVQLKYSDNKKGGKYYVSFKKETSKTTYEAYSSTDFDFLICEICSSGQFYVIPMEVLVEKGYAKTDQYDGIVAIYMASPDDYESDWTLDYLNRFDLIVKKSSGSLGSNSPSILDSIESKSVIKIQTTKKVRKTIAITTDSQLKNDQLTSAISIPQKKAPNCWQLYVKTVNHLIGNHGGLKFAQFTKLVGQSWRFMSSTDKEFWTQLAKNPQSVDEIIKQKVFESTKASVSALIQAIPVE
jgi:hypothetical protein